MEPRPTASRPDLSALDRRGFLRASAVTAGALAVPGLLPASAPRAYAAPALVRAGRPVVSHGLQAGDVTADQAVVWARADRPARMLVEVSRDPSFRDAELRYGPVVTPGSDLTAKVRLRKLAAGRQHYYRVSFADLDNAALRSEPVVGSFRTAPTAAQDLRFLWSGDMVGQGWGINPDLDGMRLFAQMHKLDPDFFIHSGDTVYADGPLQESVVLPDGRVWRNVLIEEKLKVAETLDEYRGQYRYNMMDTNVRAFFADVPQLNSWDDHETTNNWYPGEVLTDPRYTERRVDVLNARARKAWFEWVPITPQGPDGMGRVYRKQEYGPLLDVFVLDMRTYRDANTPGLDPAPEHGILGRQQARWLERELARSTATWKVIAADMPIGVIVPDGRDIEAIANRDGGVPKGREVEIAELLSGIKRRGVKNVVWVTADVHYTAANHYDPARAVFKDFDPFWEFVSGPLNAGAFGPNAMDATFGPKVEFYSAPPVVNASPMEGYQFFGQVDIDADSRVMSVALKDLEGTRLWGVDLQPQ
ncbi:alkaline phosphatase D family protein [Motilibacter deserti]|uniref:Twin-arginine translocation signal domain-containing protein n=1 Tax=Motilibacter deserti TaxID=2714956 RepID=A0ABX0GXV5_9ACTN|nr:alkaline phosphatase D family protein [Motilibacter deserti]NHC14946.1 twin-arginine translocation signal domain-containing protein [Motilibacter deserti]